MLNERKKTFNIFIPDQLFFESTLLQNSKKHDLSHQFDTSHLKLFIAYKHDIKLL